MSKSEFSSKPGLKFWVNDWTIESYKFILWQGQIATGYYNTIIRTVVGTLLTVIFCFFAAYPLSNKSLPGRNIFTTYFLITMFFGGGLIPSYLLIMNLGLFDSRWALILPGSTPVFSILIIRNYIMGMIGNELEESAIIDGANYPTILFKIIMPLAKPVIAVAALWTAIGHWNSWFDAMIYITDSKKLVLQLILIRLIQMKEDITLNRELGNMAAFQIGNMTTESVKAAVIMMVIGPIVLAFPFAQKYFIKGIMIGSLKG